MRVHAATAGIPRCPSLPRQDAVRRVSGVARVPGAMRASIIPVELSGVPWKIRRDKGRIFAFEGRLNGKGDMADERNLRPLSLFFL